MALKLHAFPPSPRSFKVLWTAHYLDLDYEFVFVDLSKGRQYEPQQLALNPNGRVPVLEDDGFVLWESNAIVNYLASKKPEAGLLPEDVRGRLSVEKWQFWESNHWDVGCTPHVFERVVKPALGLGEASALELERAGRILERAAKVLNVELAAHRYVAGDRFTVADLCIGSDLSLAEPAQIPIGSFASIQRWLGELRAMPSWQKTAAMQQQPADRTPESA